MIDKLLSYIAPHPCCGCGVLGSPVCDNCKYNIINEPFSRCLACGRLAVGYGICSSCHPAYSRAWCVGERSGVLQRLIGNYKFQNMQAGGIVLGQLIDELLPELPPETVIVPIPTVSAHIRERGYDHTMLIAQSLASRRNLRLDRSLERHGRTTQRHAGRQARIKQVETAFFVARPVKPGVPYLIIDDVVTTGATINQASKLLTDAGAQDVWVAVVARQILD